MLTQNNNLPKIGECKIAILGLGYVGLPLAIEIAKTKKIIGKNILNNEKVIGFDINKKHIEYLKNKYKNIKENFLNITFSSEAHILSKTDVFIISVPTPIDTAKRPDFCALERACESVGNSIKNKKNCFDPIVIFESTVYPGATEEICVPIIESISNLKSNTSNGFFYGYSPERINPGDGDHQLTNIKKIVSGSNNDITIWLEEFYSSFIKAGIHKASSIKVAEAAKVIENTQRDLNIALVNELAVICDLLKIDTSEVIDAASTKWNFHDFRPGLVGGHCIGIDPYYLTHKAEQLGYHPEVVLAGRRINDSMHKWVGQRMILELSKRNLITKSSEILILGLTYKANCPDLRNSQVVNLINFLNIHNIKTNVIDPLTDTESAKNIYSIKV
ncbi:nucleotide sugar dehydrogenase, partial [Prochlorococcus sp. AH-716-K03]|nr:nucleotide sugar dehydrogenase [Prochlorococcus sp. AH-716-K03]